MFVFSCNLSKFETGLQLVNAKAIKRSYFIELSLGKTKVIKGFVESDVKLEGKTTLITGSNSGIGTEVALDFARRRARVIMACRDLEKAEKVKAKVS